MNEVANEPWKVFTQIIDGLHYLTKKNIISWDRNREITEEMRNGIENFYSYTTSGMTYDKETQKFAYALMRATINRSKISENQRS